jgi:hypothetical protein
MVIDVTTDGVSLVSNYRDQFASVLEKGTATDLLVDMRRRNATALAGGRESPEHRATPFESARKALLEASGRWSEGGARVWAEPYLGTWPAPERAAPAGSAWERGGGVACAAMIAPGRETGQDDVFGREPALASGPLCPSQAG